MLVKEIKVNVSTKYSDCKRFNVETPANGAQPRYVQQCAAQDLAGDRFTALHTSEWLEKGRHGKSLAESISNRYPIFTGMGSCEFLNATENRTGASIPVSI